MTAHLAPRSPVGCLLAWTQYGIQPLDVMYLHTPEASGQGPDPGRESMDFTVCLIPSSKHVRVKATMDILHQDISPYANG